MALSDALQTEIKRYALRGECTVAKVAELHLSGEDKELYLKVLNNSNQRDPEFLSTEKLAHVMRAEGYEGVSPSSINRHRNKICPCYRSGRN